MWNAYLIRDNSENVKCLPAQITHSDSATSSTSLLYFGVVWRVSPTVVLPRLVSVRKVLVRQLLGAMLLRYSNLLRRDRTGSNYDDERDDVVEGVMWWQLELKK